MEIKYLIIIALIVLAIFSGIKKLFKLALTVAILAALYLAYTTFF